MNLAAILVEAVADRSAIINATGLRWPNRPIRLPMSWHPNMQKLDMTLETNNHLPAWRPKLHEPLTTSSPPAS